MDILDFLASDNYIPYNRTLAKQIGVENAIIFGALCGYQRHYKQQEFFREQQHIMEDTCLTEYSVRKSIKELKELGLINVTKKGLPAKYYFSINTTSLLNMLSTSGYKNDTTGDKENISTTSIEISNTYKINNKNNNKSNNINSALPCNNNVTDVFEFWNSKKIIVHKDLNGATEKQIVKSIKEYGLDNLKEYINRYEKVIHDKNYFFNTKWSLCEFLKQSNGISAFTDEGSKWLNYINNRNCSKPKDNGKQATKREYTKQEYDSMFDDIDDVEI